MDRPIIFSAPMVRALLDGRKTQTRRLASSPLAKATPSDRLYVRESFCLTDQGDFQIPVYAADTDAVQKHLADVKGMKDRYGLSNHWLAQHTKLRPSIHMPRWASRLTLIVEAVKVERLQDISEADAIAEGIRQDRDGAGTFIGREGPGRWVTPWPTAREAFADLWSSIHGAGAWEANPHVVAISFRVERANIDSLARAP